MSSYSISASKTPLLDLFRKKQRERELAERAKIPTVPCIQIHALVAARLREQQRRQQQQKQQQSGAQAPEQQPQQQQQQPQQSPQTSEGGFWSDPMPSTSRDEPPAPQTNEPQNLEPQIKTEQFTESSQGSQQTDSDAYTLRPRAFRPNYSDTRPRRASVDYVPANHQSRPGLKKRVLVDLTNETDEDEDDDVDVGDSCANAIQIKKEKASESQQQASSSVDQTSQERRKSPRASCKIPPARYRDDEEEDMPSGAKRAQKELNKRRAAEKKKSWEQRKKMLAEQKKQRKEQAKKRLQDAKKKKKKEALAAAKAAASVSVGKDAETTRSDGEDSADEGAEPKSQESICIQTDPVVVWNGQTNGIDLNRLLANIGNLSQVVIINCQTTNNTEQRSLSIPTNK